MMEKNNHVIWAIPDIHGRYDLLELLISKLNFEAWPKESEGGEWTVIFLGDMIDRGPDSAKVVSRVRGLCQSYPRNVFALLGNHELFMVEYLKSNKAYDILWQGYNGGQATLDSYKNEKRSLEVDAVWFETLPQSMEEDGFFFSHAPVPRENRRKLENRGQAFTLHELIWTYSPDEFGVARVHGNGVIGVCGHVHALGRGVIEPRFYDHYIYADAGCGCSPRAPLVAIEVKSREVVYARPEELPILLEVRDDGEE